ncbi:hypothetical protein [Crocinitomix catalasitica]|uniref:hypothetical protein n=1 Tax=Crocinitomix catalasitica TaxID=184607 RepID=UPI00055F1695|nr:hypothetical protein [Crocinitomix catalasitica]
MKANCFIPFITKDLDEMIPSALNDPFETTIPKICEIAANELQNYLLQQQDNWMHNFGTAEEVNKKGPIKGKMFGVLVVKNEFGELGYLSTYSGKIADVESPQIFVPSLFDITTNDNFITKGMRKITEMNNEIKKLKAEAADGYLDEIEKLKFARKEHSIKLQEALFDQYVFLNKSGEQKSLFTIFDEYNAIKPAAGSGECAAPKLLHYAFRHELKPLAIAEFWWGQSNPSEVKVHQSFYPACNDKCRPILGFMLG